MATDAAMRWGPPDFAGHWRMRRTIHDRRGGPDGRFEGMALLRADPVLGRAGADAGRGRPPRALGGDEGADTRAERGEPRSAAEGAQVAGDAPGGQVLRYEEEGTLRLGTAAPMRATRGYIWRFAGDRVEVLFPDGRPFHAFRPGVDGAGTDHPCGPDLYRVRYGFGAGGWWSEWEVTGPRKDYVMRTDYARPPGRTGPAGT